MLRIGISPAAPLSFDSLDSNPSRPAGFPSTHVRAFGAEEGSASDVFNVFNYLLSFQIRPLTSRVDFENKKGTMFFLCSRSRERAMLRTFVEEAAALASIALFVGMIAVWAQLIPQL
jgi:hypothetical protein